MKGLLFFLLLSFPAAAQNYYNADSSPPDAEAGAASHNVVITSVEKCYAQLSHADVLDIRKNYVKPYEECKKRLAAKIRSAHKLKAGEQKPAPEEAKTAPAPPAESPPQDGGFYRVQKDPPRAATKPTH